MANSFDLLISFSRRNFFKRRILPSLKLPYFFAVTDYKEQKGSIRLIESLPKGAGVIFRDYALRKRNKQAEKIAAICRRRNIFLLIAGDPRLARQVKAQGVHFPEYRYKEALHFKKTNPKMFVTLACHKIKTALKIKKNIDAIIVSPLFHSRSHLGITPLGIYNFRRIIASSPIPAYAMGGINSDNLSPLKSLKIIGISFIRGFRNR